MKLVSIPKIFPWLFRKYLWNVSTNSKIIYLTFDDGPTPEVTSWVLNQLSLYQAKATFFCIGSRIQAYPELVVQLLEEGHLLANHTYEHVNGWKTITNDYVNEVLKTQDTIQTFQENKTKYFRPPYGKITPKQTNALIKQGYQIVMWDILTYDFNSEFSVEKTLQKIYKYTQNGSIIVFHDSIKCKGKLYYLLPKVLQHFQEKGFQFHALPIK
ncbi:MAG: polysaccharide deacetylase family protein [Flavobacteriales bacterium]|nr:polysaccharide deacetylase family protein [Flavobacteriales bacterium]